MYGFIISFWPILTENIKMYKNKFKSTFTCVCDKCNCKVLASTLLYWGRKWQSDCRLSDYRLRVLLCLVGLGKSNDGGSLVANMVMYYLFIRHRQAFLSYGKKYNVVRFTYFSLNWDTLKGVSKSYVFLIFINLCVTELG